MRLTKSTDFALRLVLHLAREKRLFTMPQLSTQLNIPYNHLSKLVQTLNKGQIIRTVQGKHGGIKILKDDNDISLKTIIHLIDGPTRLSECLTDGGFCRLDESCSLKFAFSQIQEKIEELFENVKISDLLKQKQRSNELNLVTNVKEPH